MEKLQQEILKFLSEDARYTPAQIAAAAGADEAEVASAIKQMEKDGVIVKYAAIINNEKIDSGKVQAFIEVKVAPQKLKGFDSYAEEIYSFPEVQSLYLMSGGFDLAVFVEGNTLADVAKFIAEKLSVIDGIVGVQTSFILKKYKIEGQVASVKEEAKRQIIGA